MSNNLLSEINSTKQSFWPIISVSSTVEVVVTLVAFAILLALYQPWHSAAALASMGGYATIFISSGLTLTGLIIFVISTTCWIIHSSFRSSKNKKNDIDSENKPPAPLLDPNSKNSPQMPFAPQNHTSDVNTVQNKKKEVTTTSFPTAPIVSKQTLLRGKDTLAEPTFDSQNHSDNSDTFVIEEILEASQTDLIAIALKAPDPFVRDYMIEKEIKFSVNSPEIVAAVPILPEEESILKSLFGDNEEIGSTEPQPLRIVLPRNPLPEERHLERKEVEQPSVESSKEKNVVPIMEEILPQKPTSTPQKKASDILKQLQKKASGNRPVESPVSLTKKISPPKKKQPARETQNSPLSFADRKKRREKLQTGMDSSIKKHIFKPLSLKSTAAQKTLEIHENSTQNSLEAEQKSDNLETLQSFIEKESSANISKEKIVDNSNNGIDQDILQELTKPQSPPPQPEAIQESSEKTDSQLKTKNSPDDNIKETFVSSRSSASNDDALVTKLKKTVANTSAGIDQDILQEIAQSPSPQPEILLDFADKITDDEVINETSSSSDSSEASDVEQVEKTKEEKIQEIEEKYIQFRKHFSPTVIEGINLAKSIIIAHYCLKNLSSIETNKKNFFGKITGQKSAQELSIEKQKREIEKKKIAKHLSSILKEVEIAMLGLWNYIVEDFKKGDIYKIEEDKTNASEPVISFTIPDPKEKLFISVEYNKSLSTNIFEMLTIFFDPKLKKQEACNRIESLYRKILKTPQDKPTPALPLLPLLESRGSVASTILKVGLKTVNFESLLPLLGNAYDLNKLLPGVNIDPKTMNKDILPHIETLIKHLKWLLFDLTIGDRDTSKKIQSYVYDLLKENGSFRIKMVDGLIEHFESQIEERYYTEKNEETGELEKFYYKIINLTREEEQAFWMKTINEISDILNFEKIEYTKTKLI